MSSIDKNDKRETVDDILAETERESIIHVCIPAIDLERYVKRIKEAWKRERTKVEADALAVGGIVEAARHKPCNASAMREALEDTYNILEKLQLYTPHIKDVSLMRAFRGRICRAKKIVGAALSEPARNCDVYATPDKASKMFEVSIREAGKLGFINPYSEVINWLLVPAAERKGDGDA